MNEREIFIAALQITAPGERDAFVEEACRSNAPMRQRVKLLLKEHEALGSFLESPLPGVTAVLDMPSDFERPGTEVGPYKLLEQIGEGGFGVVFLAEQERPVKRKVALKVIKPGMDTRQVIVRFESERQALALMDHPNIAKVLDAGTTGEGVRFQVSGFGEEEPALAPDT